MTAAWRRIVVNLDGISVQAMCVVMDMVKLAFDPHDGSTHIWYDNVNDDLVFEQQVPDAQFS